MSDQMLNIDMEGPIFWTALRCPDAKVGLARFFNPLLV
jgi:hypothetical protein